MKRYTLLLFFLISTCLANAAIENIIPIGKKMHVVLIPGSGASNGVMNLGKITGIAHATGHKYYFKEYAKMLSSQGIPFSYCLLEEDEDSRTLVERAGECIGNVLKTANEKNLQEKSILLIGHSMGGNISRLVANSTLVSPFVHSVLTISTPHQGTILGDYVFEQYYDGEDFEHHFIDLSSIL